MKELFEKLRTPWFYLNVVTPIFVLLFYTFSFLYRTDLSFNEDLGRHIKIGEIMWNTKQLPKVNLFSYSNPNFPFINHHWFFELLLYWGTITVGLNALLNLKVIVILSSVLVVLILSIRTKSTLLIPIGFIFLHMLRSRVELRPEILSFFFTVVTLYILEQFYEQKSKLIFLLPFISLIWVNTHIYFPIGIILQGIFFVELLFQRFYKKTTTELNSKIKTLCGILLTSGIGTLINPHFVVGALYPFTVLNHFGVTISEDQNIFTLESVHFVDPDFLFYYCSAAIILGGIYAGFWRKTFSIKIVLLVLFGFALATETIRGFPFVFFISFPYVLQILNIKQWNVWTKTITGIFVILLIGESILYLNGWYYSQTYKPYIPQLKFEEDAKPAFDFLIKNNLSQPVFNNFDIGSYMIYRTYPKYKVFIDGRPEAYPASFFTNVYLPMQENYSVFKKFEQQYKFQSIVFSLTDENPRTVSFLDKIVRNPDWKIVFLDQFMIILTKKSYQQRLKLPPIDLSQLNPTDYHFSNVFSYTTLSTFLFNMKYFAQAKKFDKKALEISPNNPSANKTMALILYFENKKDSRVQDYFSRTINGVFW